MKVDLKFKEHIWNHIFPSIVPHSIPCGDWSYYSAKNCNNWDTANLMWSKILPIKKLKPMAVNWSKFGKFYHVNTKPFFLKKGFVENIEMLADYARLFVPNKCLKGGCHLHVFLHGCTQAGKDAFFQ
jgi:hypothetical protein